MALLSLDGRSRGRRELQHRAECRYNAGSTIGTNNEKEENKIEQEKESFFEYTQRSN